MKDNFYKLGEYKIIESDTGELSWEAHFGLGMFQEGRCFRKGAILFIGPAESHHNGFLKLEFIDHLKVFPEWPKTKYYCGNLEVFHCKTGKKVSREEMRLWMFNQDSEEETIAFSGSPGDDSNVISGEDVNFRLKRYEINKKANGQVVWKTYAGLSTLRTGACIILENILFIGPWQDEQTDLIRRQFIANLKQQPEWNQTKYYCPTFSLRECKTLNRVSEYKKGGLRGKKTTETKYEKAVHKKSTELNIPHGKSRQPFSPKKLLVPLKSLAKPSINTWEKVRFFKFNFKKPNISKRIDNFRTTGVKKWLTYSGVFILFAILLGIFFLFDIWKNHDGKGHYKKESHPSSHRRDH